MPLYHSITWQWIIIMKIETKNSIKIKKSFDARLKLEVGKKGSRENTSTIITHYLFLTYVVQLVLYSTVLRLTTERKVCYSIIYTIIATTNFWDLLRVSPYHHRHLIRQYIYYIIMKVISVLIACSTTVSAFSPATFGTKCMYMWSSLVWEETTNPELLRQVESLICIWLYYATVITLRDEITDIIKKILIILLLFFSCIFFIFFVSGLLIRKITRIDWNQ